MQVSGVVKNVEEECRDVQSKLTKFHFYCDRMMWVQAHVSCSFLVTNIVMNVNI